MTKNTLGGKSFKKKKHTVIESGPLRLKQDGEEYAVVDKMLGSGKFSAKCFDGNTRICKIPGSFYKKVWINTGDLVLVSVREFEEGKCDVITKYNELEAKKLKKQGIDIIQVNCESTNNDDECVFDFDAI